MAQIGPSGDYFRFARQNEAARAADAARDSTGAVDWVQSGQYALRDYRRLIWDGERTQIASATQICSAPANKSYFSLAIIHCPACSQGFVSDVAGWKQIAAETGLGVGTIYRVALQGSKTREKVL
jgi:hypothetical protein